MVAAEDVFSVIALFVMFRETIEASLITAILLQLVVRLNRPDLRKWVWWGVFTGVTISILVGAGFIIAFYKFRTSIFAKESPSAELFAGIVSWIASVIITILAFAMLRFLGWEAKWRRRLEMKASEVLASKLEGATDEELAMQAEQHEIERIAADRRDAWKVYLSISLVCLREGIEAVVFIAGVGNDKPSSVPLPALIGIALGVGAGMFLYYSGKVVSDLKWLFVGMTTLLIFMAAGQIANGMTGIWEGNKLGGPTHAELEEGAVQTEWYLKLIFDISECCGADATENKFFSLLHSVFGYQDKGTPLGFILYFGYWVVIAGVTVFKWKRGTLFDADFKYNKEAAAAAKKAAELEGDACCAGDVMPLPELKAVLMHDDLKDGGGLHKGDSAQQTVVARSSGSSSFDMNGKPTN